MTLIFHLAMIKAVFFLFFFSYSKADYKFST